MNQQNAQKIKDLIELEYDNITGIVVSKNNEIVYENYFDGYQQNDTVHIASVTKSIVSVLVGIAIKKGAIKSTEQNIFDFFPNYKLKRGEKTLQKMTIRDLLTMTAPYKYKYEPYTKVYSSDDWTKAVLDLLGGKKEIGTFKYTTIGIQVLSGILTNSTGKTVLDFAREHLFTPLGIKTPTNYSINDKDTYFSFLKDRHVSGWVVDPKGVHTAGWGLALTTRDLIQIGLLYLNKGTWNGVQILTQQWVEESTKTQSKWGTRSYGYLWWVITESDANLNCYAAIGDGGNVIFVSPEKKVVIAITSRFMPRAKDRIEFIKKHLLPLL